MAKKYIDFEIVSVTGETTSHFDFKPSFKVTNSFSQRLILNLNTWLEEFAYDIYDGVDYKAILKDTDFHASKVESFFLSALLAKMEDFKTFEEFDLIYNSETREAKISFMAYSKTGQSAKINDFNI